MNKIARAICAVVIAALVAVLIPSSGSASGPTLTWFSGASMSTGRDRAGVVTTSDGDVIVFGGNTGGGVTGTVERYHPATNSWTLLAPMPTPRAAVTAVSALDGIVYVIGGYAAGTDATSIVEAYNPATNTWSARSNLPVNAMAPAASRGPDGTIYIFGGYPGCCFSYLSTVFAYNETTDTWSARASMPTPREGPAAALASDGKIYVVGGNGTGSTPYYAVEAYDPTTNTWQSKAPMPIGQSGLSFIPAPNGKLYGIGYDAAGTVLAYDPSTDTWVTETPLPTPRGHVLGALAADGYIYAIGGFLFQPYGEVSAVTERASLTPAIAPSVASVSPSQGQLAGGTTVTITGTGFVGTTAVAFGTNTATSFAVNDDTSITATAPAATSVGTVDVTVTTPAGVSPIGATDHYTYLYAFTGFLQPVDNPPTENTLNAGAAVPVKFSLGGNQGLNIFATGYPISQPINCSTGAPLDTIEQTVTAGQSSLSYDAASGQYTYVWKTDKAWKNTCRSFNARLVDGTDHIAVFKY